MPPFDVPGYTYVRPLNDPWPGSDWVMLARRHLDGADVAIRLFHRRLPGGRDRQRFEHEVAGLKALVDVPYVLPLQDAGIDAEGRAHVVMAYCVSGSLHDHLLNVGKMTAVEVRRVGVKLATALTGVHQRDIVHRNVSPSNVLLDAAGEPALADFSLVALTMSEGDFLPEPDRDLRLFLAPEAYLPELMTASADIYALGVTLYTMLAGGTPADYPIDGARLMDLPKVPWGLMSTLRRAMAVDPADRFADAADFRSALLGSV
jgi:serine/threonine protein kinase